MEKQAYLFEKIYISTLQCYLCYKAIPRNIRPEWEFDINITKPRVSTSSGGYYGSNIQT